MDKNTIMSGYMILNTIKPKYYQTEYPYTNANFTFTKNVISILVKELEANAKSKGKSGGTSDAITIYQMTN